MKAILLVLAAAIVGLAGASQASARQACTPGGSGNTHTFCGPAKATLKYGIRRVSFNQGGKCEISAGQWVLNIGTSQLIQKPTRAYFGITAFGKKVGKNDAAITWQLSGKTHTLAKGKVTFAPGLKRGTFSGLMSHHRVARGSFTCR